MSTYWLLLIISLVLLKRTQQKTNRAQPHRKIIQRFRTSVLFPIQDPT